MISRRCMTNGSSIDRVSFVCDLVNEETGKFMPLDNCAHVDESCFHVVPDKQKIRFFPDSKLSACNTRVTIPWKVVFIVATVRPDPSRGFTGKIGIWHTCHMKTAQRSLKKRQRGGEYEFDVTI